MLHYLRDGAGVGRLRLPQEKQEMMGARLSTLKVQDNSHPVSGLLEETVKRLLLERLDEKGKSQSRVPLRGPPAKPPKSGKH